MTTKADYDPATLPYPNDPPPTCAACARPARGTFYVRRGMIVVLCAECWGAKP